MLLWSNKQLENKPCTIETAGGTGHMTSCKRRQSFSEVKTDRCLIDVWGCLVIAAVFQCKEGLVHYVWSWAMNCSSVGLHVHVFLLQLCHHVSVADLVCVFQAMPILERSEDMPEPLWALCLCLELSSRLTLARCVIFSEASIVKAFNLMSPFTMCQHFKP